MDGPCVSVVYEQSKRIRMLSNGLDKTLVQGIKSILLSQELVTDILLYTDRSERQESNLKPLILYRYLTPKCYVNDGYIKSD